MYKTAIGIFLGLALFLTSCKKENADLFSEYSKADPIIAGIESKSGNSSESKDDGNVNEDGITELSDSDSLSDASTAFAKNKDDKYNYKFVLKKGEVYPLHTKAVNTTTQTFRGKSATETTTSYEDVDFKVLQVQNGNYKMSATFVNSKMVVSGGGESITIDASQAAPKNKMLLGGWMIQKARKGKTVTFQMDETGTISNVQGFDKIQDEVKRLMQSEVSGDELNQLMSMVKQQINGDSFKAQVEQGIIKFPKGGASIGQTWSENNGKKGGSINFTLQKIENGKAYINVSSNIPTQSDKKTQDGVTGSFSASMSTKGTVTLDVNSGWINTGSLTDKMTQKESYTDGKQTQSTSINTTNVTTINQ